MKNSKSVANYIENHIGIWFHQGVFLQDAQKQLVNAQEAIDNCLAGKEIKPVRSKKNVALQALLKDSFGIDKTFKTAYDKLTPGKQREYATYVSEAKREATKLSRISKIIPMIKDGQGLHDKYKNC